ncbi:hypothetical protein G7Y89_g1081 [Cudoniella acicularis]|uniref:Zn(2)-C6 fungal-type domain-containing protein n=1 Tax=Cudoniella acicularis TaxID=354080 RepID=A0A8H4RWR0_9HELO|nr:hypothetical protein G7Y89_g1081 [Cudoniella acicularis]
MSSPEPPALRAVVSRRTFKKSRRGCRTCKARKVKCDEKHPLCGNCARRFNGLKCCDFDPFIETSQEGSRTNSSRRQEPTLYPLRPALSSPASSVAGSSEESRVLELRLMYHYTTTTCEQMPGGQSTQKQLIWSIDIPQLAFSSDLVLSAMLGISALHLSALTPEDPKLAYSARHYFDQAVSKHRMALSHIEEHNAESLLATAILICHHTWLASHSTALDEPYSLPLQAYYMARGIKVLFEQMWPSIRNSCYLWFANVQPIPEEIVRSPHSDPFLMSVEQDLAELSRTFDAPDTSLDRRETYEKAATEIISISTSIKNGAPQHWIQSRIATMAIRLPSLFLELIEQKDPRALALLARNVSLLKVTEYIWWLHGGEETQQVAERAITGISKMMPPKWAWTMQWPLQILNDY